MAGAWVVVSDLEILDWFGGQAGHVAPFGALAAHLLGGLVARHGGQQLNEVAWSFQIKASFGGTREKAGQHRLANVNGIAHTPYAAIIQLQPHGPANVRFIVAHQFLGGLLFPRAHAANQVLKIVVGHGEAQGKDGVNVPCRIAIVQGLSGVLIARRMRFFRKVVRSVPGMGINDCKGLSNSVGKPSTRGLPAALSRKLSWSSLFRALIANGTPAGRPEQALNPRAKKFIAPNVEQVLSRNLCPARNHPRKSCRKHAAGFGWYSRCCLSFRKRHIRSRPSPNVSRFGDRSTNSLVSGTSEWIHSLMLRACRKTAVAIGCRIRPNYRRIGVAIRGGMG